MTDTRDSFEYAGDLHIYKSDYGQISDFRFNRLSGLGAGVYRLFTATPPVIDFNADDVDELKDYRELHAAIVGNQPIWPNGWCQNVAAVAFVINNERQAALQAGAGDGAVTEAMVLRACNAYNKACGEGLSDDFYADYPEMYAAIKAAIAEPSND